MKLILYGFEASLIIIVLHSLHVAKIFDGSTMYPFMMDHISTAKL